MLLIIQFPLADARPFLAEAAAQLPVPGWPIPDPQREFVRAFGPVRRRWRGGLSGWVGENLVCEADRALTFRGRDLFYDLGGRPAGGDFIDEEKRVQFWVAFRRFYADGLALGKFEVGLVVDTKWLWGRVGPRDAEALVQKALDLEVEIPDPAGPGPRACRLFEAGSHLARLYLWSSSRLGEFSLAEAPGWWVEDGEPLLFLMQDGWDERLSLNNPGAAVALDGRIKGTLSHHLIGHAGRSFRLWNFDEETAYQESQPHRPKFYQQEAQVEARKLRLFLLRLHAEKQVLAQVIRHITRGRIRPNRGTAGSESLQRYLHEVTGRLAALRRQGAHLADLDVEEMARTVEDQMTPGEYDAMQKALERLGLRPNIAAKTRREVARAFDRAELRRLLTAFLSLSELITLCFDLHIDHENFPPTKDELIIALIRHQENRQSVQEIVGWLEKNRADVLAADESGDS